LVSIDAPSDPHVPVLLREALEGLAVRPDGTYVDATFGLGGHAAAIAARGARVVAFDRDPAARAEPGGPLELVHANFALMERALDGLGIALVDGVLFDLGVSSPQLDLAARGFSFQAEGPLDMRMSREGPTAFDLLVRSSESELARIIFEYGEERGARRIARAIVAARERGRLPTGTAGLAKLVAGVLHRSGRRERIHPATRTFQALRIAVNDELGSLARGLEAAAARTRPGGHIVAISFHSLEDRIVKQTFRDDSRLRPLTRKPVVPGDAEVTANPRARSAKLRVAERLP
jgi:16S rRNA (cytosine1402-N4)-methyltransferase